MVRGFFFAFLSMPFLLFFTDIRRIMRVQKRVQRRWATSNNVNNVGNAVAFSSEQIWTNEIDQPYRAEILAGQTPVGKVEKSAGRILDCG
ncbi:MAG: hypothetical protein D3922_15700 [Candidatus Electrothrix sp. AR1]|nr:hypothetical protein [Candidatus Electrothrix sp. AR1]